MEEKTAYLAHVWLPAVAVHAAATPWYQVLTRLAKRHECPT